MGFSSRRAKRALMMTGQRVDLAVDFLVGENIKKQQLKEERRARREERE